MIRLCIAALSLGALTACATTAGASDPSSIPSDVVETCTAQCEALDLELDAVTLNDRDVGCVCEPD